MVTKYISVPKAFDISPNDWQRDHIRHHSITVNELEPRQRNTGLLDHRGNKIMAVEQMNPIGFGK